MKDKNSLLDKVTVLTVAVTYRCNSRCRHCQIPSPDSRGKIDTKLFASLLQKLLPRGLSRVTLWGGEPLLEPEATMEILEICRTEGMKTEVITNGFWGSPAESAERVAEDLAASGLGSLHVSLSPLHQEWIPLENIRNALISALEAGIPHVYWLGKYFDGAGALQMHDIMMDEMARDMDIPRVERSPYTGWIQPVGRAANDPEILEQVLSREGLLDRCPLAPHLNRLTLDPHGYLSFCEVTVLMNCKDFLDDRFNLEENPIISRLLEEGPRGLAHLAGMDEKDGEWKNSCHLCYEARRILRGSHEKLLAPACFY